MFNPKKYSREINDFRFQLRASNFIEKYITQFDSKEEAKDFLIKFLVVECISGINYSYAELTQTYKKVRKLVNRNSNCIFSEELPIHDGKCHADKHLSNVKYHLKGKICTYETRM